MHSNESSFLNSMVKGGKTPMGTGKHFCGLREKTLIEIVVKINENYLLRFQARKLFTSIHVKSL